MKSLFFLKSNRKRYIRFKMKFGVLYVNADQMQSIFPDSLKGEFLSSPEIRQMIELSYEPEKAKTLGIYQNECEYIFSTSRYGMWFHEELALVYAQWLDDSFAEWMKDSIEKMKQNGTQINPGTDAQG